MPNVFNLERNMRYTRTSIDDYLPWSVFERLKYGATVPIIGNNPLRYNPTVAWHTAPIGQFFHTHNYRLKRSIAEGDISEFCKALSQIQDLDVPVTDKQRLPMISLACKFQRDLIARVLLMRGANTEARDLFGQTPLHLSVLSNSYDCAQLLIETGADPNTKDDFGMSPIELAKAKGQAMMVRLLETSPPTPKLVRMGLRNSLRESGRLRRELLGGLRRESFGEPTAYPFNNLKGVYSVSLRN